MTITDEVVEIVAASTWNATDTPGFDEWTQTSDYTKSRYRRDVRTGLEALLAAGYRIEAP